MLKKHCRSLSSILPLNTLRAADLPYIHFHKLISQLGLTNYIHTARKKFTDQTSLIINNVQLALAIKELQTSYGALSSQRDLSPDNEIVNVTLKNLVLHLIKWNEENSFNIEDMAPHLTNTLIELPRLCAMAECEMEKWWARKIITKQMQLEDFWYLNNYQSLVNAEAKLLGKIDTHRKIIFLGSGALPLTAQLLAKTLPGNKILCIDQDAQACQLASDLIKLDGSSNQIEVVENDAESYAYTSDDIVFCACLLHSPKIYNQLYKSHVRTLVVRNTEDLFRFLYTPTKKPDTSKYVETKRTHPDSERINVSHLYERAST